MGTRTVSNRLLSTERRLLGLQPGAYVIDDQRPLRSVREDIDRRVDVQSDTTLLERLVGPQASLEFLKMLEEVPLLSYERLDNSVFDREGPPRSPLERR